MSQFAQLSEKRLLVVFIKEPVAGQVKTRLCPDLSPQEAAALYQCMIADRLEEIHGLNGIDLAIAFTPARAREVFVRLAESRFALLDQRGRDLGERLHNVFVDAFSDGYTAVSIIDSDSPDLPGSTVQESFQLLQPHGPDVVFGPCHDGGYYLVGMRKLHPELFADIPWSMTTVLQASLETASNLGLKTALLSWQNDLDTIDDLILFYTKYNRTEGLARQRGKNTLAFLSQLERITDGRQER